jgi:hypothetical protein
MGASGDDALDAAADELYGLPPEEFTSRRGELAKAARAAGDKAAAAEMAKLRKPTVPAWLVNLLSREAADELSELLALGEELRQAQAQLLGPRMKELSQRASAAVQQLSRRAAELAGARGLAVPAAVDRDVEQTLRAALADPQAEVAVSSGRLTRALAYAGFGEVDVTAATATPLRSGAPRPAAARPAATRPAGRSAEPAAGVSPADERASDREPSAVAEPVADGTTDEEPATGREPAAPRRRSTAGRTAAGRATPSPRTPASTSPHRSAPDHAAAERAAADRLAAARTADEAARAAHEEALRAAEEAGEAAQAAEQLVGELQEQLAQARRDAVTAARDAATARRAEQRAARAAREAAAGLRAATSSVPQPT